MGYNNFTAQSKKYYEISTIAFFTEIVLRFLIDVVKLHRNRHKIYFHRTFTTPLSIQRCSDRRNCSGDVLLSPLKLGTMGRGRRWLRTCLGIIISSPSPSPLPLKYASLEASFLSWLGFSLSLRHRHLFYQLSFDPKHYSLLYPLLYMPLTKHDTCACSPG